MDRWLRRFLGALAVYMMILGGARWLLSNAFGPPADHTGSPGDGGVSCTACHTGPAGSASNITLSGVPASYTPGQSYALTLTVGSAGGKRGFEIVSERDSSNAAVGSWSSLGSGVQANGDSLSHQNASSNNSWTFTWTAPNPGAGGITFYIAGNVADGLGSTSGDQINLRSYAVPQAATPAPALTGLSPAFGSVGTDVTLTGTDFTSTLSTVNFSGGTSTASVVSWANSSIVAKATGSASGNVSVTNANGASGGASFTLITGAPSISSASPQAVDRASGTVSIRVGGANLSPGSTVALSTTTPGVAVASAAASGVALTTSTQITTATFTLNGMATGYWKITVTNPDAKSGTLADALLVQIRPDAPQSLQAQALSSTTILWSWRTVGGNADSLRLYTSTGGAASPSLAPPASTYLESLYSPNEAALRSIAAFNAVGSSNSAVLTTASLADKPSGASAAAVSSSAITLAWSAGLNPSDTLYEVSYSSVDAFLSGASISTAPRAPGTTAAVGALAPSTTYHLRVRALNRRGVPTEFDAAVSTLTAPPLPAVPGTPSGAALGVSSISWTWAASAYALSYDVYSASSGALLASPASPAFAQTGLSTNTACGIRVRGVNATGASPLSAAATTYSAAAQPGRPAVAGRTSNSISLSWDASGNPSGTRFEISLSTDDFVLDFTTPVPLASGLSAAATTFGGLRLGATYYARARAFNGDSAPGGFSERVSTLTLNFPDPPSGLAAAALSSTTLLWTWTDASSDEAGFRVYSATAGQVSPDLPADTTSWLQTWLPADTSAQNRVAAFAQGGGESPASAAVRRFTLARVPSGAFALPVDGSSVSLRVFWSSGGASGFSLERATSSAGDFSETASSQTLAARTTSYLDRPLSASTSYFYRLRAYNGDGAATGYGDVFSTRTHPASPAAPSLSGAALSSTSIRWSWSAVAGAEEYALKTGTGALLAALSAGTTETTESGLQPGTVYERLLTASNAVGLSTSAAASVAAPQSALAVAAASSAAFTVAGASLSIPSGWLPGAGSVLASADPLNKPLTPTVAQDVSNANASLGFLRAVPGTLRQFLAYEGTTRREADFLAPVSISLEYPDADGNGIVDGTQVNADTLAVYFLREGGASWTKLPGGGVDKAKRSVSAPTTHFTLFTLVGGAAASDLSGARVFPNPLRPSLGHSKMTFRLLPASSRVRIYTLAGERVAQLEGDSSGTAIWDGRNSSGRPAASGVYLAVVEGNGEKRTLKVAIQR